MNPIKVGLLAALLATPAFAGSKNSDLPKYKPGQCVQDYRYYEPLRDEPQTLLIVRSGNYPWRDEPQILLIVRSGNYHYLMVAWFKDVQQYSAPFEELISNINQYKRTLCPAKYPDANLPKH